MPSRHFPGRLFGPGLPASGSLVEAQLDDLQLRASTPDGRRHAAPLSQLSLRRAGFNDGHWQFGWSDGAATWALLVDDAAALAAIEREPPAGLASALAGLQRQRRRGRVRRGIGLSAIGLWLALPLLGLLALLLAARPLAGWLAGLVPVRHEVRLGDAFFARQKAGLDFVTGTEANRAVEAIGARLVPQSAYPYRWHVVRDATLNAFAVPGGIIVVHSGLIEAADSADELAGVLAHEVEHVERRHSLKAMVQQAGLRLALAAIVGDIGLAGTAAGQLSGLSFSRDSEREADEHGLERLVAAGFDPQGMLRLFAKLDAGNAGITPPAWLSSHPATPERIEQLRARIAAPATAASAPAADIDWKAVEASLR